ncbi:hypothetical protein Cni_G16244 [Canna indica]|uniref:Protein kinase domain-containing protein n=1 Tax=Canna indica TaxID=4628 RepID=A0AAQ3KJT9_9LILI|nr:hypothetical protein Cni_G16244 [Canna indica]
MTTRRRCFLYLRLVLAFLLFGSAPPLAVAQKAILLEFKGNVTSDPGGALASWDAGGDPCRDFAGVFCDGRAVVKILIHGADLAGFLSASLAGLRSLQIISLFDNRFSGGVPPEYAAIQSLHKFNICELLDMNYVSVRNNSLSGTFADKVTKCQSLELFDLGSNAFSGEVPFDLLRLQNLSYFNVSSNNFQGEIPDISVCSEKLMFFDVSGNKLSGAIPSTIANCQELRFLDLGFNNLCGRIPLEIASLKSLSVLRLGNNAGIEGSIPAEFGGIELLQILDIQNLQLSGEIPITLSQCQFLLELNASGNQLVGGISDTLYNITYLKHLDLHRNQLNGTIPSTLGQLTELEYLDFSENSLTGTIPDSFAGLTLLTYFNVSYNNLSCSIPSTTIQQFGPLSFSNNPLLCGPPLNTVCASGNVSRRTRVLTIPAIVAIVAASIILLGVCMVVIMNIQAYRKKVVQNEILVSESTPISTGSTMIVGKLVLFSKNLPSKYEDWESGTKALLNKECVVGHGSIGTVYKITFEIGVSIAVKKLETLGRIRNQEEFEQEISQPGSLNHPNLVKFHGYYWSSTLQLMLSEFIPNGSLYEHLHGSPHLYSGSSSSGGSGNLLWSRRFSIALGTAKALAYLHDDCRPQVLHLNVKSTNILLDEKYESKLSDYGLGKLLPILDSYASSKFHMSVGYVAPELASQSFRYSDKCDVYSFGVILLEIVTGRKPVERSGVGKVVVLQDYVRGLLADGTASVCFDRKLNDFAEAELIQVLKLGLICTSEAPSKRPKSVDMSKRLMFWGTFSYTGYDGVARTLRSSNNSINL